MGKLIQEKGIGSLSMFSGASGIALSANCISKEKQRYSSFIFNINHFIVTQIEQLIFQITKDIYVKMYDYDVISGISGIASYCMLFPDNIEMIDVLKKIVLYIIEMCQDKKVDNMTVPAWYIPPEHQFSERDKKLWPKGCFNIGLSHGIPGPLVVLCNAKKIGICVDGLEECAKKIADFLIKFCIKSNDQCFWGTHISLEEYRKNTIFNTYTRDAWCYGTPGVAYSLILAGKILKNEQYVKYAIEGMRNSVKQLRKLYSPTFCHGFAGIAYISYRFYEITGLYEFKQAYMDLFRKIMTFYDENAPFGFYNIENSNGKQKSYNSIGLIDGTVGVLLTLLSIQKGKRTPWDHAFLLHDI
ncbi:lanthionine synthetase C family protein [Aceticella autotrophica]|uniref:lanthionine synthetase C family protein n=1 Tax=Aceticella autotrophica TaxID=2755338 RepID=UPI002543DD32|nr:lanthionine synthetase C family protein [Aceticella autotrophica]